MRARLVASTALLFFLLALSPVMKRKTPHKAVPRRQNDARTQTSHFFASETASGDNPVPDDSVVPLPGRWYASGWPFFLIRVYFPPRDRTP